MVRILKDFISLFFPRVCINCKKALIANEEFICLHCRLDMPLTNFHKSKQNPLKNRLSSIANLHQAYAYLKYTKGGIAQKLLRKLKYEGFEEIGYKLGLWMGHEIKSDINHLDMIIPVPLHSKRLEKRGYNQSDSICNGLSESLGVPWSKNIALRKKYNETQTRKSKTDRWLNSEQLFEIVQEEKVAGKSIVVVDDIITTGATIESLLKSMNDAGAKSVNVACLASGQ